MHNILSVSFKLVVSICQLENLPSESHLWTFILTTDIASTCYLQRSISIIYEVPLFSGVCQQENLLPESHLWSFIPRILLNSTYYVIEINQFLVHYTSTILLFGLKNLKGFENERSIYLSTSDTLFTLHILLLF